MCGCMLQYKNSTIQRRTEDGNEDEGGRAGMGLPPRTPSLANFKLCTTFSRGEFLIRNMASLALAGLIVEFFYTRSSVLCSFSGNVFPGGPKDCCLPRRNSSMFQFIYLAYPYTILAVTSCY